MKDFFITFTDADEKKRRWDHVTVRCSPNDETYTSGDWKFEHIGDVFNFRDANRGWYQFVPNLHLFLCRSGANNRGLERSLARFHNLTSITNGSAGDGHIPIPLPPKAGKLYLIAWELAITDEPDSEADQPPPDQDEANDLEYRRKVHKAEVDIRNYVEKPELQERLLKEAKEWVGKIKNEAYRKRAKEDLEQTEKNYMHKKKK
ncbi:MAG: hypothetical protein WBL39_24265 [Terrimicrobiaceae bacterium]